MSNCRMYGNSPYKVAVIHGGPGGAGTLKILAQMLSDYYGVLEPLQTKDSLETQLEELRQTLEQYADLPVTLIGHSWGAMLAYLFAAKYPQFVKKLIMVGSGLFDSKYAKNIMETRLERMSKDEQNQYNELMAKLQEEPIDSDELFHQMGKLMEKVDCYDPINVDNSHIKKGQYQIYTNIWPEVSKLRETGELLKIGKSIKCPVIAIHGNYDSHPYQGVKEPLSMILNNFNFILLDKCGHEPWVERQAKDQFMYLIEIYLQDI